MGDDAAAVIVLDPNCENETDERAEKEEERRDCVWLSQFATLSPFSDWRESG